MLLLASSLAKTTDQPHPSDSNNFSMSWAVGDSRSRKPPAVRENLRFWRIFLGRLPGLRLCLQSLRGIGNGSKAHGAHSLLHASVRDRTSLSRRCGINLTFCFQIHPAIIFS